MIDKDQILHVATLARLDFSQEELGMFTSQIGSILEYVNQLDEVAIDGVEPTCFVAPCHDPLRSDEERPSLPQGEALANGPFVKRGHFAVPKVIAAAGGA